MKDSKGITLVALAITIVVMIILAGVTIKVGLEQNGIISGSKDERQKQEISMLIEKIKIEINEKQATSSDRLTQEELESILTKYGKLSADKQTLTTSKEYEIQVSDIYAYNEVISDGTWDGTKSVNTPKIDNTGLTPVYWNGTEWIKLNYSSSKEDWNKWYDYSNQQWANAESKDGSMWVWIPRYEYKINSDNSITVNFKRIGDSTTSGYILHPAFSNDINNGGWTTDLEGFWVAKYQAGYQNSTTGETNKEIFYSELNYTELGDYSSNFLAATLEKDKSKLTYPVFKPNTYAYNIISVGDAWILSQEIGNASMYGLSNVDSHLLKNSEWGAVAYLAQSSYGLNSNSSTSNEIAVNTKNLNNSVNVANASTGTKANVYAVTGYANTNKVNDISASTTKNMTGIFDLSGCTSEYVAGFYAGGNTNLPKAYNTMANSLTTKSSKYMTLYTANEKNGDATNETAGWNSDYSFFISKTNPIFSRGGDYSVTSECGLFAFTATDGTPNSKRGFRACLAF